MAHEPPRIEIEHFGDDGQWHFVGAHWTYRQAFAHLEHLRGRGWRVRVQGDGLDLDLQPGDDWEGQPWV